MRRRFFLAGLLALLACRDDLDAPATRAALDEPFFRCNVQPVLTKNCSMLACHGDGARYFRQYSRNRLRYGIGGEAERNAPLNAHEHQFNFESARAYVEVGGDSLLLKKPLEASAGGYFHRGATRYAGGNVFRTTDDPEYLVLVDWVNGKTADATCIAPGEDQ